MFAFLIALCSIGGGLTFGGMMIVGVMLYSGRWALPGSPQRGIQQAKVSTQIAAYEQKKAEHEEKKAEHTFKTSQIRNNQRLMELEVMSKEEDLRDRLFQKALAAGKEE